MRVTVIAAEMEARTAWLRVIPVRPDRVWIPERPCRKAPRRTNRDAMIAAVVKRSILEVTAGPITLEASLAPRDHPRKTPPRMENI
jgi:hypothetical protein